MTTLAPQAGVTWQRLQWKHREHQRLTLSRRIAWAVLARDRAQAHLDALHAEMADLEARR
jgi:hypothetical protein